MSDPASADDPSQLTLLLNAAAGGDPEAARQVMPLIYEDLRRIARDKRRSAASGETLRTTALVHEAYLRVVERRPDGWEARSHFYFTAARAMRDILVEDARKRAAAKHGGGLEQVELDEAGIAVDAPPERVLALNDCLKRLQSQDELGHQIVLLRFFVGLNMSEIAEVSQHPLRSVERKWSFVRAWLGRELSRA